MKSINVKIYLSFAVFLIFLGLSLMLDDGKNPSAGLPVLYMGLIPYFVAVALATSSVMDNLIKRVKK